MAVINENTKLPRICRKCFYRRNLQYKGFYNGNSRTDSCCAFMLLENELRGCTPTDGECARFKPRTNTKSLKGRHEMIK
jgi:hypothetical protein